MKKKRRDLVESAAIRGRLDKDAGIVRGVKILGAESDHGYRYTSSAMKNAISLYEGKPVNIDHPKERSISASRRYADRFGRISNVHFREGKSYGLYGDLHYNKGHRLASQFEWDVENNPNNLGLSQMARGSTAVRSGKVLVESIQVVKSVDVVADPATNQGLFESKGARMKVRKKKRREASKGQRRRQLMESLRERIDDLDNDELSDLFEAATTSTGTSQSPMEAMGAMLTAIFMDGSMDMEQKREKINAVLDLADEQEVDKSGESDSDEESDASADASGKKKGVSLPESKGGSMKKGNKPSKTKKTNDAELVEDVADVKQELNLMRKERRIMELCEDAGFKPTKIQKRAMLGLTKVSEVKELIESFSGKDETDTRKGSLGRRPKSSSRRERNDDDGDEMSDKELKSWAESLAG